MAASVSKLHDQMEKLSKILECNICLERITDPKTLHCTHAFCKCCLDNILKFQPDGSGVITCPLRCESVTIIEKDGTTNDLLVPMQFRNLMEMFNLEAVVDDEQTKNLKCHGKDILTVCNKDSTFYCYSCSKPLCDTCRQIHEHYGADPVTPVRLYQGELHPWCTKHNTISKFMCDKCTFGCMYCRHRTCGDHVLQDIAPIAQEVIQYVRVNEPNYSTNSQKLVLIKSVTEDTLEDIREKVGKEFENRKIKWLASNLKKFDEEEKKILNSIDVMKTEHYNTYPATGMKDLVNDRPNFDVVLNKDKIIQQLTDAAANQCVPMVSWTLSEGNKNNPSIHSLEGIVEQKLPGVRIIDSYITNSIKDNILVSPVSDDDKTYVTNEIEKLMKMELRKKEEIKKEEKKKEEDDKKGDGELKFKPVSTGTQKYRVEKKKKMITQYVPCYAWTEGEDNTYQTEVETEELIPYEESYEDLSKIKNAIYLFNIREDRFLKQLVENKVETILIELVKVKEQKIFEKRDNEGYCLMHWAAEYGCIKLLLYILQYDMIKIDVPTWRSKFTPLHRAICMLQYAAMEVLIAYGADLNVKSVHGNAIDLVRDRNDERSKQIMVDAQKPKDVW